MALVSRSRQVRCSSGFWPHEAHANLVLQRQNPGLRHELAGCNVTAVLQKTAHLTRTGRGTCRMSGFAPAAAQGRLGPVRARGTSVRRSFFEAHHLPSFREFGPLRAYPCTRRHDQRHGRLRARRNRTRVIRTRALSSRLCLGKASALHELSEQPRSIKPCRPVVSSPSLALMSQPTDGDAGCLSISLAPRRALSARSRSVNDQGTVVHTASHWRRPLSHSLSSVDTTARAHATLNLLGHNDGTAQYVAQCEPRTEPPTGPTVSWVPPTSCECSLLSASVNVCAVVIWR